MVHLRMISLTKPEGKGNFRSPQVGFTSLVAS